MHGGYLQAPVQQQIAVGGQCGGHGHLSRRHHHLKGSQRLSTGASHMRGEVRRELDSSSLGPFVEKRVPSWSQATVCEVHVKCAIPANDH
jgi:hypothetical protein